MNSEYQENERGITIISKKLAVMRDDIKRNERNGKPYHTDFGGEVERILKICDRILLVVESIEGPKPQMGFVLARPEFVVGKKIDLGLNIRTSGIIR